MSNERKNRKKTGVYFSIPLLVGYCAVFFFSFLLTGQNAVALSSQGECRIHSDKGHNLLFSNDHSNAAHNPFDIHISIESDPEGSDQHEAKDHTEGKFSEYGFNSVIAEYFKYSNAKRSVLNFISSIQNRQTVSLYIFYHSWKSFLS